MGQRSLSLFLVVTISIISILGIPVSNTESRSVFGQAPYLETNTNNTAKAFCGDGDGIISGGYSLGFASLDAPFNTSIISNHPIQEANKTGYFEGWETALVNRGFEVATISATTLCLNLTLTP